MHENENILMKSLKSVSQTAIYTGHDTADADTSDEDSGAEEPSFPLVQTILESSDDECDDSIEGLQPLYFLYDCEGTGGSIYSDYIIELAVVVQPLPDVTLIPADQEFHTLIYTANRIAPFGKIFCTISCAKKV